MSFAKEFKEFAMKGNVVDLAVGVIIGAAFGKIVSSLVADVIMPILGLIVGGISFTDLKFTFHSAVDSSKVVTLNYGLFIQSVFDFTLVAFAIFLAIKGINKLKKPDPAQPAAKAEDVKLLEEIRDLLKAKQ
jgi:large conductance mechanosensitive channel